MKILAIVACLLLTSSMFSQNNQLPGTIQHKHWKALDSYNKNQVLCNSRSLESLREASLSYKRELNAMHPNNLTQLIDSLYSWQWDTLAGKWKYYRKIVNIVYDAANNRKSDLEQEWNGKSWVNYQKTNYSYDGSKNLVTQLIQNWNMNTWVNFFKFTNTYDLKNNLTISLSEQWNVSAWSNYDRFTYTYDTKNNVLSYIAQYWANNIWVNELKLIYTYNTNNKISMYLQQNWNGSSWQNYLRDDLSYDANSNEINDLTLSWNGIWENSALSTSTYDANNKEILNVSQLWNGNSWENSFKSAYTYSGNGDLIRIYIQSWNGNSWDEYNINTKTYDANHFVKSEASKYYLPDGSGLISGDSAYYYFHTVTTNTSEQGTDSEWWSIYPNPNHGKCTIQTRQDEITAVEIYNTLGARIYINANGFQGPSIELDLTDAKQGIYFIKLYSGSKSSIKKMVLK